MSHRNPCLVLENLSRDFGGLKAVDRVSLTVQPGERRALIGPNGAGKTTLFNLISGAVRATGGRITLFGADVTRLSPHRRAARGIARTFQITNLFPNLTVLENLLLACEALDPCRFVVHRRLTSYATLHRNALALLDRFGLADLGGELAKNISYGDQRKLDVALAVGGHPRLLLLDEPMAGLSSAESASMQQLLKGLDAAITILLIEHDMDVAFGLAEQITVLHQGSVLIEGHADDIRTNPLVQEIYLGTSLGSPRC